jgi:hypothetical protein
MSSLRSAERLSASTMYRTPFTHQATGEL